jgi:hypothetical protein
VGGGRTTTRTTARDRRTENQKKNNNNKQQQQDSERRRRGEIDGEKGEKRKRMGTGAGGTASDQRQGNKEGQARDEGRKVGS